jgi:hypothetical protein
VRLRLFAVVLIAQCGRELTVPVKIDQIPPLASRPAPPRFWLWLTLLVFFLLLGIGVTWMSDGLGLIPDALGFWEIAVSAPLLVWSLLGFARASLFIAQQQAAESWDQARAVDLLSQVNRGRRSLQVFNVSLYTALQKSAEEPDLQLDALLNKTSALTAQPSWSNHAVMRHSRLPCEIDAGPERTLFNMFARVLADLAHPLSQWPDDVPLALLLEIDSQLPESHSAPIWQQAWRESGIRQTPIPLKDNGLAAVDKWLDQLPREQTLLLVVALQCAPSQPEGTAEAAVGLLLGGEPSHASQPPIAFLHRPEQERAPNSDALRYALHQALEWVPLEAKSIAQVWRAGVDPQRDAALVTVLTDARMPNQEVCDMDALLGLAGKASPWLAIAAAAQACERGTGPQFIFSGDCTAHSALWSTVLMPAPATTK